MTHDEILEVLSDVINIMDEAGELGTGDKVFEIIQTLRDEWGMSENDVFRIIDTETAKEYLKNVGAEVKKEFDNSYIVTCKVINKIKTYDVIISKNKKGLCRYTFHDMDDKYGNIAHSGTASPETDKIYVIAVLLQQIRQGVNL